MSDVFSSAAVTRSTAELPSNAQPVFGIFEGGGAKGIAHVGAYAAAAELGFEFVGVAGASAGSIVAALIALGFSQDEIFNPKRRGEDVFSDNGFSPVQLLGESDWLLFKTLKWKACAILGADVIALTATLAFSFIGFVLAARISALLFTLIAAWTVLRIRKLLNARGLFDPVQFAGAFNAILHRRVKETYIADDRSVDNIPTQIRFRDIDPNVSPNFCRLKIVVTDVSGQQLRLFDHRTPDVVVAEAVAASIAIPGIFKPAYIPSYHQAGGRMPAPGEYADGGLVSNLPVWCFAEEKAATERRAKNSTAIPIIAFTLNDANSAPNTGVVSPFNYAMRVLRTGIFGGQTVVQEFVSDICAVQLKSPLSVLAFDAKWDEIKSAYDIGRRRASEHLYYKLKHVPQLWSKTLKGICEEVSRMLESHLQNIGQPTNLLLRASVFQPIRPLREHTSALFISAYRATHSFNMERDADDRLTLDAESPGVPEAFSQRNLVLLPAGPAWDKAVMTKYERALVRRSVKSAICIPIFDDAELWNMPTHKRRHPLGVISFDSDEDIIPSIRSDELLLAAITEPTFELGSLLAA